MTNKQTLVAALSFAIFSIIVLQLIFIPNNSLAINSKVGNTSLSKKPINQAINMLGSQPQTITIAYKDGEKSIQSKDAGISIDAEKTVNNLTIISLKDKLVPLLPIIKPYLHKNSNQAVFTVNDNKLNEFSTALANDLAKPATDATATIENNQLNIKQESAGVSYDPAEISNTIKNSQLLNTSKIELKPNEINAKVDAKKLSVLNEKFDKLKNQQLTLKIDSLNQQITSEQLISTLDIINADDTYKFVINKDKILPIFTELNQKYSVPAGTTQVKLIDDVEVSRQNGQPGKTINKDATFGALDEWVNNPNTDTIQLKPLSLAANVIYQKQYSKSSAQLQAKINTWIATHNGVYQVAIVELGGQGREASYNVNQQTVMASTYKTFLAYTAYKLAESGSLDLNSALYGGKNIEQCIATMIINSDNDCAVALGRKIGWAKADQIIAAAGFNNVKLNNYDSSGNLNSDKMVNAKEQAKFIAQLSAGSLISGQNTNKLLGYMKNQVYRNGIPAGSRGAVVADKVGFLYNYLHDVGVVYETKSTYAIVVMSEGSSWSNIKDLSQAIYDFMNE